MAIQIGLASTAMIALNSQLGQLMLHEADTKNDAVVDHPQNMIKANFSGPASIALVLNVLQLSYFVKFSDYRYGSTEFMDLLDQFYRNVPLVLNEDDVVGLRKVKSYFHQNKIGENELSLEQLQYAVMRLGFASNVHYIYNEDSLRLTEEKRKQLKMYVKGNPDSTILRSPLEMTAFVLEKLKRQNVGLIANFDLSKLWYGKDGRHFSVIGGLNKNSILMKEVDPLLKPTWIDSTVLYNSMQGVDENTGFPRGIIEMYLPIT